MVFVLPELHHQGIGSFIIDTLEADELFLRADRIEIPASITAVEFYRKKGSSSHCPQPWISSQSLIASCAIPRP